MIRTPRQVIGLIVVLCVLALAGFVSFAGKGQNVSNNAISTTTPKAPAVTGNQNASSTPEAYTIQSTTTKLNGTEFRDSELVKNGKILIPSLKELIASSTNYTNNYGLFTACGPGVRMFSTPNSGNYLYIDLGGECGGDSRPYAFDKLFSLNLKDHSLIRLMDPMANPTHATSTSQPIAFEVYGPHLLPGGKDFVSWDNDQFSAFISVMHLAQDTHEIVYMPGSNETLVKTYCTYIGPGQEFDLKYNVQLAGSRVTFGVYDETQTASGTPFDINQPDKNLSVWTNDGCVDLKLLKTKTLTLPTSP